MQAEVDAAIDTLGISFAVYDHAAGRDRAWPLDLIPRVIDGQKWDQVTAGLQQRLRAINLFIHDIYHEGRIFKDGPVPEALIKKSPHYRPQCAGANPPLGVWAHICGTDLVRDADGEFYVLEDNLRVPSGVSYMLENREVMFRVAADLFAECDIRLNNRYPRQLRAALAELSPRPGDEPAIVVLTPGHFNSAYFEHVYLARQSGAQLAEGRDMVVVDDIVYLRTIAGLSRVDVIYRRIDDWFLDPAAMSPDSQIGVAGLMRAWRAGNVAIVSAPGCGVADDKVICTYIPEIIKYYTGEDALIPNVPTWRLSDKKTRDGLLSEMHKYVFKPANEAGGYGVVIGPAASKRALSQAKRQIIANPRGFVAQPLIALSTSPTVCGRRVEPRHVDLRPFTVQTASMFTTAGGLTRVAHRRGSYIVNSSQGGGSKDTWIIDRVLDDKGWHATSGS
jgi:uncharacterized circularly permuted ATP-grasp superfamily protein